MGYYLPIIGIGLFLLSVLIFIYVFVDCRRRRDTDFPPLVYGGKVIGQESMKQRWTWILTLSFVLGWAASLEILTTTEMHTDRSPSSMTQWGGASKSLLRWPFLTEEVYKISETQIYRKRAVRFPLLFFIGAYLYYRWVKRWPREQEQD